MNAKKQLTINMNKTNQRKFIRFMKELNAYEFIKALKRTPTDDSEIENDMGLNLKYRKIKRILTAREYLDMVQDSSCLFSAFTWSFTPFGHEFWSIIDSVWRHELSKRTPHDYDNMVKLMKDYREYKKFQEDLND